MLPYSLATATAKSLQSCPTLCDPREGSPPGSPVPGILQARTLEWVAISFSNAWKWKVKVKLLSRVWLFATPQTAAHQAPPPMGFSRQEYWSGVPSPCPHLQHGAMFAKASQVARAVKNLPTNTVDIREMGSIPGLGRSPGRVHGNPLSILTWRIPWTEEPVRLPPIGWQRVRHDWSEWAQHSTMSSLNTLLFIVHELVLASAGNLLEKRDLSKVHALSELESHSKNKSPDDT